LNIELKTEKVFLQKLNYIQKNPVRTGVCKLAEAHWYSSAALYELNKTDWKFLTLSAD